MTVHERIRASQDALAILERSGEASDLDAALAAALRWVEEVAVLLSVGIEPQYIRTAGLRTESGVWHGLVLGACVGPSPSQRVLEAARATAVLDASKGKRGRKP